MACIAVFNQTGKRLALVDYTEHGDRYGAGSLTLRRGALAGVLLDAVQAGAAHQPDRADCRHLSRRSCDSGGADAKGAASRMIRACAR